MSSLEVRVFLNMGPKGCSEGVYSGPYQKFYGFQNGPLRCSKSVSSGPYPSLKQVTSCCMQEMHASALNPKPSTLNHVTCLCCHRLNDTGRHRHLITTFLGCHGLRLRGEGNPKPKTLSLVHICFSSYDTLNKKRKVLRTPKVLRTLKRSNPELIPRIQL